MPPVALTTVRNYIDQELLPSLSTSWSRLGSDTLIRTSNEFLQGLHIYRLNRGSVRIEYFCQALVIPADDISLTIGRMVLFPVSGLLNRLRMLPPRTEVDWSGVATDPARAITLIKDQVRPRIDETLNAKNLYDWLETVFKDSKNLEIIWTKAVTAIAIDRVDEGRQLLLEALQGFKSSVSHNQDAGRCKRADLEARCAAEIENALRHLNDGNFDTYRDEKTSVTRSTLGIG